MIVLTGATGQIGRRLLALLLEAGETVRVIVRDPARLPDAARARVEVIVGSHGDAGVVARAFKGADQVFWLVQADVRAADAEAAYSGFARPGIDAMRQAGVARVVGVSALGRGWPEPAGNVTATLRMDDEIAATGIAYRALACGSFMENVLRQVDAIRTDGVFATPLRPDRAAPVCATADIALAAARLLRDPSWGGVDSVPILGPDDLSGDDMARIMSETLERPVRCRQLPIETVRSGMIARGASPGMARAMVEMMTAKDRGMDETIPRTGPENGDTSFRQWCVDVLRPAMPGPPDQSRRTS